MSAMIKHKLELLPKQPGCYLMKDNKQKIIYVGKAKVLKSRVSSYFNGAHDYKTTKLVSEIEDFEYIVTDSEKEALLLEINLIKQYNPKYNIMFMDDAYYPYIQLTQEKNPKLRIVRDAKNKKARHFGPFPDAYAARETFNLLNRLFPLRKCGKLPDKVCLYYHLGQCIAPCIQEIPKTTYDQIAASITRFLNGETKDILVDIKNKMFEASEQLAFEQANEYKSMIKSVEYVVSKQSVQEDTKAQYDVFAYFQDNGYLSIQVFMVRQGKLLSREMKLMPLYEAVEEAMQRFIVSFYEVNTLPKQIIVQEGIPTELLEDILTVSVTTPKRGHKLKLLTMARKNAEETLTKKFMMFEKEQSKTVEAIEQLRMLLDIRSTSRIELFDNSNIQGVHAVSGMVVYVEGVPSKKDYRKFKIQSVEGANDYATMEEVLYRRYFRVIKDRLVMPDLIVVDGGIGQINIAKKVKKMLNLDIPICGLSKDDKHQTATLINEDLKTIDVPRRSELFYLLTRMQDEVHRYALSFHKQVRSKSLFESKLDKVEGLGPKRRLALLKAFGSMKGVKEAEIEALCKVVPKHVAIEVKKALN